MDDYTELLELLVKVKSSNSLIDSFKINFLEFYQEGITEDVITNLSVTGFDEADDSETLQYIQNQFKELKIKFYDSDIGHITNCCDLDDVQKSC